MNEGAVMGRRGQWWEGGGSDGKEGTVLGRTGRDGEEGTVVGRRGQRWEGGNNGGKEGQWGKEGRVVGRRENDEEGTMMGR